MSRIDECFSPVIIGLLRLDSRDFVLVNDIANIYRRVSDSLNIKFCRYSSIGSFITKIGTSLHASLSVFSNIFISSLINQESETVIRQFLEEPYRSYRICHKSSNNNYEIDMYRKDQTKGINKGGIIVIRTPESFRWYMKTFHLAFIATPNNENGVSKKYQQISISSIRVFEKISFNTSLANFMTDLLKGTALELINSTFFDLREPLVYVLLEYLGLGPQVVFFLNLCVFGGLYILTKELKNFRTLLSEFPSDIIQNGFRDIIPNLSIDEQSAIFETLILIDIMMLEDLNGNNIGFVYENGVKTTLSIIDFVPPSESFISKFFENDIEDTGAIKEFQESFLEELPLSKCSLIDTSGSRNLIKEGFLRLKRRVNNLVIPGVRILSYPSMSVDGISHSPFTQQFQYSTQKVNFREFLNLASEKIQDHLFREKTIIDGKTRENYDLIGFIKGYMQPESNFSSPKRFIDCSKNMLENYIEIVCSRYEKYDNLF